MVQIDKNIPMKFKGRNSYPFGEMEVGDSFYVSLEDRMQVVSAASWYGTRNNKKFSVRKHEDACRCWRVS